MSPKINLTGRKFGRLTVLREDGRDKRGELLWLCLCGCGRELSVRGYALRSGRTRACGCLRGANKKDLAGQKFGRLTALREEGRSKHGAVLWECLCDCGRIAVVAAYYLRSGKTKSCGCLRTRKRSKNIEGQKFGRLTVVRRKGHNKFGVALWVCACDCGNIVVVRGTALRRGETISCGCSRIKDIAGQKFGRLTVVRIKRRDRNGGLLWECLCDCGNTTVVYGFCLRGGQTKSCGCIGKSKLSKKERQAILAEVKRKNIANLDDSYVANRLCAQESLGLSRQNITPELIELKREQLKMYRGIKELKNGTN